MPTAPFPVGVCSWSLQVTSIPELKAYLDRLGADAVQIACGDPHHATWAEGDAMPAAAVAAGLVMCGSMLGFAGEDYTTPDTIRRTGGFADPATRAERLDRTKWGLARTRALGLTAMTMHAGVIPPDGDPGRRGVLDTLAAVATLAQAAGVVVAFETGQDPAAEVKRTLDDLASPFVKVNFDPANVLLYDTGDPLAALDLLFPDVASVHAKDANRPTTPGAWGTEVPLGRGETDTAAVVATLVRLGFTGPVCVEREVGTQAERAADIEHGVRLLRSML